MAGALDMTQTELNVADMDDARLMHAEREIARQHIGKFPWFAVTWAFTNLAVWLALWPLVLTGTLPLWLGFLIACITISLAYLPSHEAQHDIIARPGEPLRWLNELVGHLSVLPLVTPYRVLRYTHLEHHKHTNNPELDPDYGNMASGPLAAIWTSIRNRQPRAKSGLASYGATLERIGRSDVLLDGVIFEVVFYTILITLAWTGFALEAALLWWLPRHVALSYITYYLSWAPHHPGTEQGRYRNTRSFRALLGNIGSLGMQYHVVHHLHPRIPLYRTPMAYWQMKPILEARKARISEL